jgi:formate dehydrogenase gamma subunit
MNAHELVRFSAAERISHGVYVLAFAVLLLTGAVLYLPWVPLAAGEAGQTTRLVHRIFALVLLAAPLVALLGAPRRFLGDLGAALRWRREDGRALWVLVTRYYWTGDAAGLPPQGKFSAGQKANILVQAATFVALGSSGVLLWLGPGTVPLGILRWSVAVHAGAAVAATCFVIVHVYMTIALPMTKGAIASIVLGTMDHEYARRHHPRWRARP